MKKKIFGSIVVIAIAAIAAFNVNFNSQENNLSGISLANVEALAQSESDRQGKYNPLQDCCSTTSGLYGCYVSSWPCWWQ